MIRAGHSTPLLGVVDVERSISFYERLGFELIDTDRAEPLGWARLHCEGGAIMLARSSTPADADAQRVMLYMYTDDLIGLRAQLSGEGFEMSDVGYPPWMPRGEFTIHDPDGYMVGIGHWGREEHEAWLQRIGRDPRVRRDEPETRHGP